MYIHCTVHCTVLKVQEIYLVLKAQDIYLAAVTAGNISAKRQIYIIGIPKYILAFYCLFIFQKRDSVTRFYCLDVSLNLPS